MYRAFIDLNKKKRYYSRASFATYEDATAWAVRMWNIYFPWMINAGVVVIAEEAIAA